MTTQSWSNNIASWFYDTFIGGTPELERHHAEKLGDIVDQEVDVLETMERTLNQAIEDHYTKYVQTKEKIEKLLEERECIFLDIFDVDAKKLDLRSPKNNWKDIHNTIDPIVNDSIHRSNKILKKLHHLEKQRIQIKRHISECKEYEHKVNFLQGNENENENENDNTVV